MSMGDPGGIGPEIIMKSILKLDLKDVVWIVVGSEKVFRQCAKKMNYDFPFSIMTESHFLESDSENIFLNIEEGEDLDFEIGKVSKKNALLAMKSLEVATQLSLQDKVQGLCTAPINKTTMRLICPDFIGHTEFLAERSKSPVHAMAFFSAKLRVVLVTIHLALKDVAGALTEDLIYEKILLMDEALRRYTTLKQPKIAVCALNPHGRESGDEEDLIIAPAVEKAKAHHIDVVGPLSADQLFYEAYSGHYDAVVSMYHDQGLAPFKMVSFYDGVNVTLGLPFVRTSPDHGTAFDIAFQNKADSRSMESAMRLVAEFVQASHKLI